VNDLEPASFLAAAVLLAGLLAGCSAGRASTERHGEQAQPRPEAAGEVTYDEGGFPHGLHNFHRWSPRISQGGGPEDDEAFANLARLGFRTVLSVDGARPDVELAEQHGLRYVHVPIGYDGMTPDEEARIVKAVEASDGPVYVHCHHGKHRGPAAAQIARIALDGIDNSEAVESLRVSGCSPDYAGLFHDVETFRPPSQAVIDAVGPLPSAVVPVGLKGLMSHIDERWDYVKASQGAAWTVPARFPDIDPPHEVGMIENSLREAIAMEQRGEKRASFLEHAHAAQEAASSLEAALRGSDRDAADVAYEQLGASCKSCHGEYRD